MTTEDNKRWEMVTHQFASPANEKKIKRLVRKWRQEITEAITTVFQREKKANPKYYYRKKIFLDCCCCSLTSREFFFGAMIDTQPNPAPEFALVRWGLPLTPKIDPARANENWRPNTDQPELDDRLNEGLTKMLKVVQEYADEQRSLAAEDDDSLLEFLDSISVSPEEETDE